MLATILNILVVASSATALGLPPEVASPSTAEPALEPVAADDEIVYQPDFFASSRPSTALDMVRLVPGFSVQGGSFGRGMEGSATNVLIDGQQVPGKGEGVSVALMRIPAASVVKIVRLRGAQPGIDMGGYTEVLNIIVAAASQASGVVGLSTSRMPGGDSRSLEVSGSRGRPGRSLSGSVSLSESDSGGTSQFSRDGQTPESVESLGQSSSRTGNAATDQKLGVDTTLRGDVSYGETTSSGAYTRSSAGQATLEVDSVADATNHRISGRIDHKVRDDLSAAIDAVSSASERTRRSDARSSNGTSSFAEAGESSESAISLALHWTPKGVWQFDAGIDYAVNEIASISALGVNGVVVPLPGSDIEVSERRFGAMARAAWSPAGVWSANAALRVNRARIVGGGALDDSRSLSEIKPELNVQGKIGDKTSLDIRLSREIDQLDFGAFMASAQLENETVTAGNPQIDAERRWVVDVTLRHPFLEKGQVSLTANGRRIDNPTEVVRLPSGYDVVENIDSAVVASVSAQLTLPLDHFGMAGARIDLNGTLGNSRITDPTTGESRRLSGDARASWSVRFRHDLQGLPLSYGLNVSGWRSSPSYRPEEVSQFTSMPSASGFIAYHLRKNITLSAQFDRIGGRSFERLVYDGIRTSGALATRQVQEFAATTSANVSLRIEL